MITCTSFILKKSYYKILLNTNKLANIYHVIGLNKLLREKKSKVLVNAVQPGYVDTNLGRHIVEQSKGVFGDIGEKVNEWVSKTALTPEEGALTTLYVATSPEIRAKSISGQYFEPIARHVVPSAYARDEELMHKWWDAAMDIIHEWEKK